MSQEHTIKSHIKVVKVTNLVVEDVVQEGIVVVMMEMLKIDFEHLTNH